MIDKQMSWDMWKGQHGSSIVPTDNAPGLGALSVPGVHAATATSAPGANCLEMARSPPPPPRFILLATSRGKLG